MDYITPIEKRCEWLAWGNQEYERLRTPARFTMDDTIRASKEYDRAYLYALPVYGTILNRADTFTMNPKFAALVDHARRCAPDDLTFDDKWLLAPWGWCWLEQPFEVPIIQSAIDKPLPQPELLQYYKQIRAVGWRQLEVGMKIPDNARTHGREVMTDITGEGCIQVCCYQERWTSPSGSTTPSDQGFTPWSWFVLRPGDRLGDRVRTYEQMNIDSGDGSNYVSEPGDEILHPKHELRWVYAALHLMAQRLSVQQQVSVDRATRRRVEKKGQVPPPFIKVITLRRLELDRVRAGNPSEVDWQWQWSVVGHWRWQFYPSEGVHKRIFIESFIKGPEDKPLKPGQLKLFRASR